MLYPVSFEKFKSRVAHIPYADKIFTEKYYSDIWEKHTTPLVIILTRHADDVTQCVITSDLLESLKSPRTPLFLLQGSFDNEKSVPQLASHVFGADEDFLQEYLSPTLNHEVAKIVKETSVCSVGCMIACAEYSFSADLDECDVNINTLIMESLK